MNSHSLLSLVRFPRLRFARRWQSLGFGIQSHTDYAFLYDVLKEHHPYYAYETLAQQYPEASHHELRRAQMLYRIANHFHPKAIIACGEVPAIYSAHLCAPVPKATLTTQASLTPHYILNGTTPVTIVLDTDSPEWQQLSASRAITYDIEDIGIAIHDDKRYPEHYKIKI